MSNYLAAASADLIACNKCALCQEVCPAFAATTLETDGARGRNQLIRLLANGQIKPAVQEELRQRLATCLLCGACTAACPSGVATDRLVVAAREALARPSGPGWLVGTVLHTVLRKPSTLDRAVAPLRVYESSGLRSLLTRQGTAPLPGWLGRMEAMVPPLPRRSFRAGLAQWQSVLADIVDRWERKSPEPPGVRQSGRGIRVAYFCGCLTNAMFSGVAEAVYGVLTRNGYQVSVPDIACCGAAHEAYGDREFLLALARRNVDALSGPDIDVVVADCATCAHTLIKYRELLADDPAYADRADKLAAKVREICQLLVEGGFAAPGHPHGAATEAVAIAYHDPCHLARGLGVREQPRQVLRAVPGVTLRELPGPELCCGGAGSFAVTQPVISDQILERKMSGFRTTGAAQLATACPACMLQLGAGLRLDGIAGRPVHPCELLWRAYVADASSEVDLP